MPAAVAPTANRASPPAPDAWRRTTDEEEIARRRERARAEAPPVENLDRTGRFPVFSNFAVRSPSGATYAVEVRALAPRRKFHCPCVDFRVNGLETCKHVESVLLHLENEQPLELAAAEAHGSPRVDLAVDHGRRTLILERGREHLPENLARLFDAEAGYLLPGFGAEVALELWETAAAERPELRVSGEVGAWLECRRHEAESFALRRSYEENVQAGRWPAHETRRPLFPYQREGMLHLACVERALLADEPPLDRTVQALATCALLHRLGHAKRALVVVPASLRGEWVEAIERLTDLPQRVLEGSRPDRLETLAAPEPPFFTLAAYEQIGPDALEFNARLRPDIIIFDEAQRLRNWNSRLALSVKRLESRYAFVLTGAPPDARLDELYSLVSYLDPTVLGPLFRFNREYHRFDDRGRPSGYRNLEQLRERVRPLVLRRRAVDVPAQVPVRTERLYLVNLPEPVRERCETLEARLARQLAAPRRDGTDDRLGRDLSTLRLAAGGLEIPSDDPDPGRTLAALPKARELARVLRECMANAGQKVIVCSEWETVLESARALCARLRLPFAFPQTTPALTASQRREEIRRFRTDPDCRVLLTTDGGSPGLHLPEASVVVHLDQAWSAARMEARVARIFHAGDTPRPVTVLHLVSENTLEHRLYALRHGAPDPAADATGLLDPTAAADPAERLRAKLGRMLNAGSRMLDHGIPEVVPSAGPVIQHPASSIQILDSDFPLSLARRAAPLLGEALIRAEERFPEAEGVPSVLLFVVENGRAEDARRRLGDLFTRLQAHAGAAGELPVRLEILDRAGADTLASLRDAGLLRDTARASRALYPLEETLGVDGAGEGALPLTDEEQTRARVERADAVKRLRMARVFLAEDMTDEARSSLAGSILAYGRALAVEHRLAPLPGTILAATTPPIAAHWPPRVLAGVRAFARGEEDAAPEPALEALSRAPLAPEPPRAAQEFFAGIKRRLAAL